MSLPLASTPLVIESIGALADRDALKLLNCIVFVFASMTEVWRVGEGNYFKISSIKVWMLH